MTELFTVIASIFGLIAVGYGAARSGLLGAAVSPALNDFVFVVAIPVLLFRTIATADFGGISPWSLWITYFAAVGLTWGAAHLLARRAFGGDARLGVVAGISASFSNTVLIGIPLVQSVLGERGLVAVLVIVAIHLPVMMLASVILFEWARRADGVDAGPVAIAPLLRRFGLSLARNPIVVGIAAGAAWRLAGLPLSGVPERLVSSLAQVAGPTALFSAGMSLASYGIGRNLPHAGVTSALKLALMPAVALAVGTLAGLPAVFLAACVLLAGCPTGVNPYLIATRLQTGQALATGAITLTTAAGAGTVALWLLLVRPG